MAAADGTVTSKKKCAVCRKAYCCAQSKHIAGRWVNDFQPFFCPKGEGHWGFAPLK
jgi:hypothetical protein